MASEVRRKVVSAKITDAEKRRYPSKHYVYVIQVVWNDGSDTIIFRRYSRFFDFQISLLESFPMEGGLKDPAVRTIPFLPGKILFRRSQIRDVAMKRLKSLDEYVNELLQLPPRISQSDHVLNFFESKPEDLHPPAEETARRKTKDGQDIAEISGPILLEQYTAIADYTRTQAKELTVSSGQLLEVVEKHENGWWFVSDEEGERGWVPGVYLEKRDGTSENLVTKQSELGKGEKYITTAQFTGGKDEVSFGVGVLVEVLQKNLEGWWYISYQGKQGWAPASYLERPADAVLRQTPTYKSQVENRRSLPADAAHSITPLTSVLPSSIHSRKHLALTKTNSNPLSPSSSKPEKVSNGLPSTFRAQAAQTRPPPKKSSVKRASSVSKPLSPPPLPPSPAAKDEPVYDYFTKTSFQADIPHGISFQQDKKVKVLEKSPGDWWYISLGDKEGWAPASHIERVFRKLKPHQVPTRPKPPSLPGKPSEKNQESNFNRRETASDQSANLTKGNPHSNQSTPATAFNSSRPGMSGKQNSNTSDGNTSKIINNKKVWGAVSTATARKPVVVNKQQPVVGNKPLDASFGKSTSNQRAINSVIKSATASNANKNEVSKKTGPPLPPAKPTNIMLGKPKPPVKPTVNNVAKGDMAKKQPIKPKFPSKKPYLPKKEISTKDITSSNFAAGETGRVDFRSMLKPTSNKPHSHGGVSVDKSGVKKPPNAPEKPVIPGKPAKPTPEKPKLAQTPKSAASPFRPGLVNVRSNRKPHNQATKPVLRRFQTGGDFKNHNGNNNSDEPEKPAAVIINRVAVDLVSSNIQLPFKLRGLPDGQVDTFKTEEHASTTKSKNNVSSIAIKSVATEVSVPEGLSYIALLDFSSTEGNEMAFSKGDQATLIKKSQNDWWYMQIKGQCGWVPSNYFQPQLTPVHNHTDCGTNDTEYVDSETFNNQNMYVDTGVAATALVEDYESYYSEIAESDLSADESQSHRELYQAGSGFSATDDSMVSLAFGDVLEVMQRGDTGWWYVKTVSSLNGTVQEGWVPADYLDKLS